MISMIPSRVGSRVGTALIGIAGIIGLSACYSDAPTAVNGDNSNLYAALRTDVHAVTVAVSGTQLIVATPLNSLQQLITGTPPVTFRSEDTSRVVVSSNGVITAKAPTIGPIRVIASLQYNETTRADTVRVGVTSATAVPATLIVAPTDSANLGLQSISSVTSTVLTAVGDTIKGAPIYYRSGNFQRATVDPSTGDVTGVSPGKVTIYATTTVYGVTLTDSTAFMITYQTSNYFYFYAGAWYPSSSIVIEPGSVLEFDNYSGAPIDVIFSDSSKVGAQDPGGPSGDISPLNNTEYRRFNVPGTYTFHAKQAPGVTVTVIVKSAAAGTP